MRLLSKPAEILCGNRQCEGCESRSSSRLTMESKKDGTFADVFVTELAIWPLTSHSLQAAIFDSKRSPLLSSDGTERIPDQNAGVNNNNN